MRAAFYLETTCILAPFSPPTAAHANADTACSADPNDFAAALAFGLRFHGRQRVHNADEFMVEIVAKRVVEH